MLQVRLKWIIIYNEWYVIKWQSRSVIRLMKSECIKVDI